MPGEVEHQLALVSRGGQIGSQDNVGAHLETGEREVERGQAQALCAFGNAPGRRRAVAEHPFQTTRQWQAWQRIASGNAFGQKALIEALEDHREENKEPDAATLVGLLRVLRGTVNASAEASLDPNGGTKLEYTRQTQVSVTLPETITIGIPILRGHTVPDANGVPGPVHYELVVRIRVDVLDEGKIAFRLSMPSAEQALEDAVMDRVRTAQALLDEAEQGHELLRAAS